MTFTLRLLLISLFNHPKIYVGEFVSSCSRNNHGYLAKYSQGTVDLQSGQTKPQTAQSRIKNRNRMTTDFRLSPLMKGVEY